MNRSWTLWIAVGAVILLLGGGQAAATLWTEGLWFSAIGHFDVFRTQLVAQLVLGLAGGLFALLIVGGSARVAARQASAAPRPSLVADDSNPFGTLLANIPVKAAADGIAILVALVTGSTTAGWWREGLLFLNGGAFGWQDPVWGLDAAFYVFDLPLILDAQALVMTLIGVAAVVTLGLYVARGVVRLQLVQQDGQVVANGVVMPPEVRRHLGSLAAAFVAVLAVGTYLQRYTLMYADVGLITGPGYADLHGTLPLLTVQAIATAIAAFLVFVGIDRAALRTALAGMILVVVGTGLTSVYPSLLDQFNVKPNELSREGPQIVDHIEGTRYAFDLDGISELPLSGKDGIDRADIEANGPTVNNIRLWDHDPLMETFSQVQEIRTYYGFVSVDNDRYVVDGELRQIMMSPRELTIHELPEKAKTWVNETMTYTHGYGVALGPVNQVNEQGLPVLWVQDLPPKVQFEDSLGISRPELYFGEATVNDVVVDTDNPEFDYPVGDRNEYTTYEGSGGVSMAGLNRVLFALRSGNANLLFSGDINEKSRILLHRHVLERAAMVAPFVVFDRDPYLVIDERRLVWILDGYTLSSRFPYSKQVTYDGWGRRHRANYLRNSVKITVDAYDGTVTVWLADESDPIVKAWGNVFPGLLRPLEQMPAGLRAHLRYPIDQFAIQADLFASFHMQDHQIFYNREDEWEVPVIGSTRMEPYYTIMRLPGEPREEFILMLPFSPKGKPNLAAWMVARADGDALGELRVYKFPKDSLVYGPKMVVARINQDDEISEKISLWDQQGSNVQLGTLLVIPIEESLIYVQPLYLQADQNSIPELKRVIVAYGDDIAMEPTLEEGLAALFGGAKPPDSLKPAPAAAGSPEIPPTTDRGAELDANFAARLVEAAARYEAATEASQAGDWARYGREIEALGKLLHSLKEGAEPAPTE